MAFFQLCLVLRPESAQLLLSGPLLQHLIFAVLYLWRLRLLDLLKWEFVGFHCFVSTRQCFSMSSSTTFADIVVYWLNLVLSQV